MSRLWVPPTVTRQAADATAQHQAAVDLAVWREDAHTRFWNPKLKAVDPYLELVKARDVTSEPGLIPGYWHIMRHVPGAPATLIPLMGPRGEYVEPSSQIMTMLEAGDLQNERVMRERRAHDERAAVQRARDEDREAEDRVGQMVEHARAITRAHVSMTDARPWTNAANRSAA